MVSIIFLLYATSKCENKQSQDRHSLSVAFAAVILLFTLNLIQTLCITYSITTTFWNVNKEISSWFWRKTGRKYCYFKHIKHLEFIKKGSFIWTELFLFPTNLSTDKRSLLTSTNIGWNVLAKIHYECDTGGILFHRNNADYMSRISDKHITLVQILLHDENCMTYITASKWTATLKFTYYEEYEHSN